MTKGFQWISCPVIDQYVQWVDLWERTWIDKVSVWWIYVSENVAKVQQEWWQKVNETLNNTWEQTETEKSQPKYIDIDTMWWKWVEKKQNYFWRITKVRENDDKSSCEITYRNWIEVVIHQLHKQNEIIDKVSTPEKILTETFGLTRDQIQFYEDWSVKLWQTIKFNPEQKVKVQKLIERQVIETVK